MPSNTKDFIVEELKKQISDFHPESQEKLFGKVIEGQDVVDKIKKVKTGNAAGHQNVPVEDVIIEKAEVA